MAEARIPSLRNRDKTNLKRSSAKSTQNSSPKRTSKSTKTSAETSTETSAEKVEVRRSARRHRTVTAYRKGDTLVVLIPAKMSRAEEEHWVAEMQRKLQRTETRPKAPRGASDEALLLRCAELSGRYLDGSTKPASVRWVPPMRTRWASCTPADRTIRVSEHLRNVPQWVLDYVLIHELAHLRVAAHNAKFWALVRRYPKTERAIGYLEGLSAAEGLGIRELDGN